MSSVLVAASSGQSPIPPTYFLSTHLSLLLEIERNERKTVKPGPSLFLVLYSIGIGSKSFSTTSSSDCLFIFIFPHLSTKHCAARLRESETRRESARGLARGFLLFLLLILAAAYARRRLDDQADEKRWQHTRFY